MRVAYAALSMVKADLINRAMEAAELDSPAAREAVDALFESVSSALARGDRVVLRRFGVFYTSPRNMGKARNPRTVRADGDSPETGGAFPFRAGSRRRP